MVPLAKLRSFSRKTDTDTDIDTDTDTDTARAAAERESTYFTFQRERGIVTFMSVATLAQSSSGTKAEAMVKHCSHTAKKHFRVQKKVIKLGELYTS